VVRHLPATGRRRGLVQPAHAGLDLPPLDQQDPFVGERVELQVGVAESPGDVHGRVDVPLLLDGIVRRQHAGERDPAPLRAVAGGLGQSPTALQPAAGGGAVAVHGQVVEGEVVGGEPRGMPGLTPGAEPGVGALPEIDRPAVVALPVPDLRQPVEGLG
jgi:hypothetical protein